MSAFAVKFLTRKGCHLCDEARPGVVRTVCKLGGTAAEVDIDSSSALVLEYALRIPVVLGPEGHVLAEGRIDPKDLEKVLRELF